MCAGGISSSTPLDFNFSRVRARTYTHELPSIVFIHVISARPLSAKVHLSFVNSATTRSTSSLKTNK